MNRGLSAEYFHDEHKAREYIEGIRWPDGAICPHCGNVERSYKLKGKSTRLGVYKCGACRKQFTVTVGSLFERSRIPLHKWLTAAYLLCASKKGISSLQLQRTLRVTYKTAWFMTHRLREAMKDPVFTRQLGGEGVVVEPDETFWGNKGKQKRGARGWGHKEKIFSLIERNGKVRSFHVPKVSARTLRPIMRSHIRQDTQIMTDDFKSYVGLGDEFVNHGIVKHSAGEYVRGKIHTNTVENYFGILKRGLIGIYQHVGTNHLRRYIGEFDFRYNNRLLSDVNALMLC